MCANKFIPVGIPNANFVVFMPDISLVSQEIYSKIIEYREFIEWKLDK